MVVSSNILYFVGDRGSRGLKGEPGTLVYQTLAPISYGMGTMMTDTPGGQPVVQQRVAFSATMDHDQPSAAEYRVLLFNLILTNLGDGYDSYTGIFHAPVNGTYLVGFSGVSYHGQNVLLHLVRNTQRVLSAYDNSGCGCCGISAKCAGSASNVGILGLQEGDKLWVELPDQYGLHNALYHNYASFWGVLIAPPG